MKPSYQKTIYACFIGYIVQAIVNNFVPLLFLTFEKTYRIPLSRITMLITINFGIQLLVDLLSAGFVDKIGYRISVVLAHIFAAVGLAGLVFLPDLLPDPFAGLLLAVCIYALGGGLIEVLISPIVESCPTDNKEKAMSLLHSFYCWGHVGVVLLSTIFFSVFGIVNWKILACIWALVPVLNACLFVRTPIAPLIEEGETGMSMGELFCSKVFWLMMLMMLCAGASEQAVSQWASTFAEKGLGVTKTIGDLAGPMLFAILMGSSRAFYGKAGTAGAGPGLRSDRQPERGVTETTGCRNDRHGKSGCRGVSQNRRKKSGCGMQPDLSHEDAGQPAPCLFPLRFGGSLGSRGTEPGQQRLVVVELQLRTHERGAVHFVEHPDESILVLHVGAGHPGHAQIAELQLAVLLLVLTEKAVAVGASRNERVGGIEFQREGIRPGIDRFGGDSLHLREFPGRAFECGLRASAASRHGCKQNGSRKNLFHALLFLKSHFNRRVRREAPAADGIANIRKDSRIRKKAGRLVRPARNLHARKSVRSSEAAARSPFRSYCP